MLRVRAHHNFDERPTPQEKRQELGVEHRELDTVRVDGRTHGGRFCLSARGPTTQLLRYGVRRRLHEYRRWRALRAPTARLADRAALGGAEF